MGGKTLTLETAAWPVRLTAPSWPLRERPWCGRRDLRQDASPAGFLPLTVNYQEKFYAAGKIPGSFPAVRAPLPEETLTSRLIDRPIRPLFVKVQERRQVVCTVLPTT